MGRPCPWKGKELPWQVWNRGKTGLQVAWNKGKKFEAVTGDKNHNWRGDAASMTAHHQWIHRRLGKPQRCEHCGTTERRAYHWSNISGEYLRDVSDYQRLCVPCHKRYDLSREK